MRGHKVADWNQTGLNLHMVGWSQWGLFYIQHLSKSLEVWLYDSTSKSPYSAFFWSSDSIVLFYLTADIINAFLNYAALNLMQHVICKRTRNESYQMNLE